MREYCLRGYKMLAKIPFLTEAAEIVRAGRTKRRLFRSIPSVQKLGVRAPAWLCCDSICWAVNTAKPGPTTPHDDRHGGPKTPQH
jgi:hypothetical protein